MIKIIKKIVDRIKQAIRNYDKSFVEFEEQMKVLTPEQKANLWIRYFYHIEI